MNLAERIRDAGMAPDLAYAFQLGLEDLGGERALPRPVARFVEEVLGPLVGDCPSPAPFEELWPYADLFLSTAILLSVASGAYDMSKTRAVGAMAARLGVSATELARTEARVFAALREPEEDWPDVTEVSVRE